jgi:hypothetical protein
LVLHFGFSVYTRFALLAHPALKRWAKLCCP